MIAGGVAGFCQVGWVIHIYKNGISTEEQIQPVNDNQYFKTKPASSNSAIRIFYVSFRK